MGGSDFIFDGVNLLYYRCLKINFKRSGSYIDSADWIKKATINPKDKDDKCFQYPATVALFYGEIQFNAEIILNIKLFK